MIPYEGMERTSAERGLNMFLAACSGEIARGDVGEKLKLHSIATETMRPMGAAVGAGDDEDRAMDAVLETTILFNWKCANHNGMAISEDKQWLLLANSVPFRALRAGDFSLRPPHRQRTLASADSRDQPGGSASSTIGTGSLSAASTAGEPGAEEENLTSTSNRQKPRIEKV